MAAYTVEERELAKSVNILDYLRLQGYTIERSGREYQLKEHDSLKISADGTLWKWHSRDKGGKIIDLVKELEDVNAVEAIKKLAEFAQGSSVISSKKKVTEPKKEEKVFQLPERNATNKRVFAYLTKTRSLDEEIVQSCIKHRLIYESKKYHNAVFVGQKDESGHVRHASLRGTYTNAVKPFKGDVQDSDKAYSFAIPGRSNVLIVCESAIDVLSQATLTKMGGGDWTEDHRLALGGMSDLSLQQYLEKHPEIITLVLSLDNDKDAVDKNGNPDNHGQKRAERLAREYKEKGYEVLNTVTQEKDLNEELQVRVKGKKKEDKEQNESVKANGEPKTGKATKAEIKESNRTMDELWSRLEEGVKAVYTSDNYKNYLKFVSKFYHYSLANCLLIAIQKPEASLVAGYQAWRKKFSRTVKKGEKGIQILAPMIYKGKALVEVTDKETGKKYEEEREVERRYFKPVYVFDISQTEGKEVPELTPELKGDVTDYSCIMEAIKSVSQYPIVFEAIERGAKGYFSLRKNKIAIAEGMEQKQNVKTAIHELAHSRVHVDNGQMDKQSKTMKEVQAESIAFIVCEHLGLDTSDYSFPYVAAFARKDIQVMKDSLKLIQGAAKSIIMELEKSMQQIREKTKENDVKTELGNDEKKGELEEATELFKKGYIADPMKTMSMFQHPVKNSEDGSLNQAILFKDPLIQQMISEGKSYEQCIRLIESQLSKGNQVSGKVKVQIISSDQLPNGEFYSLKKANEIFGSYEAMFREKNETATQRKMKFALYVEDEGKWKYGASQYELGSGYADNLMDFISKNMKPEITEKCQKELMQQEKTMERQQKNKEERVHE